MSIEDMEYLQKKRLQVLEEIRPICDVFNIKDYDYIIQENGQREILRIYDIKIGCSCNSISAVKNELIGFIFLRTWGRDRSMGAFDKQSRNVIKQYWMN
ncbi:MAG: hypothetical protein PHX08_08195 [Lachnospiraceae bacterium]|nr:hypothetical protein [Lachnospiraceae bacterium]